MISFSLPHYTLRRYGLASECDTERDPALFPRGFAAFASPRRRTGNCTGNCTGNRTGNCTGNRTGNCTGNCTGNRTGNCTGNRPCSPSRSAASGKRTMRPPQPRTLFSYPCPPLLRTATGFFAPRPLFISPTALPSAPRAVRANRRTVCRNKRSFTDRLSSYGFPSSNVGCSGKARRRCNAPPRFSGLNAARKRIFQKVFRLRTATYAL